MMGEIPGSMSSMSNTSSGMVMQMTFTNNFRDTSVLFEGLKASTKPQAFGIFCLFFFVAFILRGLIFVYVYIEQVVWRRGQESLSLSYKRTVDFGFDDEIQEPFEKQGSESNTYSTNSEELNLTPALLSQKKRRSFLLQMFYTNWKDFEKDIVRLILSFLIAILSYSLMLVIMSYITCYFFAVVLGIAVGEVWFKRLERISICNEQIVNNSEEILIPTPQALSCSRTRC
ncbi:uncharacterized protein AC631_05579 [Debaryomyces fabryi]|uniref:Copper transport protein n=1 Tax=Debaryomyces fabryi TaxID=58627 RepID=A0A0V1PR02_9ASCO|nr:uncharacterized protein AC631_05579 [Debaryomyces fabryi]KRZ98663.1 hypothetical protein AC631_05579 [Debaryomyces fabryi]CUM49382.1 unnamed protein product [Debaryomyces fabryi]